MRRATVVASLFALSLAVMPGVYELLWYAHPDYFRVQSGVNVLPTELFAIASEYSAYKDGPPLPSLARQSEQDTAAEKILELYRQFQSASVTLSEKNAELRRRQVADAETYKSFEKSQFEQLEQFVASKAVPFQNQIQSLIDAMQSVLKDAGATSAEQLSTSMAVAYSNLAVKLATARSEMAAAEVDARTYAMAHLTDFQKLPAQQDYLANDKQTVALEHEIMAQRDATNRFHGQLYDAFVAYRDAALQNLGYWDFFYFSVGAATTATFGDIAPNSKVVRILVCIQVLGSIIGTGIIVSGLTKDLNPTGTPPVAPPG